MLSNANTAIYHLFIIVVVSYNAIIAISQKPFLLSAQNVIVNISNFSAQEQKNLGRGMGGLGLPGDLSSMSRFVRAAFTKLNSLSGSGEAESVGQFFHILGSVEQVRGCCEGAQDKYEITIYTSCFNADKGVYYYTTYNNRRITAVDMHRENLDSDSLARYPMLDKEDVFRQN